MAATNWDQVVASGLAVPSDRPLDELAAELTAMLGSADPTEREETALATLETWVSRGVYDDLLAGLGDGMATGLEVGLGQPEDDSVFRRSASARMLGRCLARDNEAGLLSSGKVLEWGDRLSAWYVRERDLRGFVTPGGWARAAGVGADAIAELAASAHLGTPELTVMLDVIADRLLLPTPVRLTCGEPDRMARAVCVVLSRDLVPLTVLEPWVARLTQGASGVEDATHNPWSRIHDVQAFLRALYLRLSLGGGRPGVRSDLLLVVVQALKSTTDLES